MHHTRPSALCALVLLQVSFGTAHAQAVTNPLEPSRLPGAVDNTKLLIPPLAFAPSSVRSVPVLASAGGALPAVEFDVVTTGGAAPVTLTIAGGTAAAMFEVVSPPPSTLTRQPTAAELAAAQMEAQVNPTLAGTTTRRVRFKGTATIAGLPASLPVQLRARDGQGRNVTGTVTVYPYQPRVTAMLGIKTAHESQYVQFRMEGLGSSDMVRVDSVSGDCGYLQNSGVSYSTTPVAAGAASVGRWTTFRTNSETCSNLRVQGSFRFPDSNGFAAPVSMIVPTFAFTPRRTYAFEDTWTLRDFFAMQLENSVTGTCNGKSIGTDGTLPVGILESGGDITLHIRSGPLGTECNFASRLVRLPDGLTLKRLDFERTDGPNNSPTTVRMSESSRYCSIGDTGGTFGPLVKYDLTRGKVQLRSADVGTDVDQFVLKGWQRPLVTADGVTVVAHSDQQFASVLLPIFIKLQCNSTLSNTEFIRLRLKRVEFTGPPGLAFP